jgi:NADPH:quinone reductase-like Zn-dependent oxidoreductase
MLDLARPTPSTAPAPTVSATSAVSAAPAARATMKAVAARAYGPPESLRLEDVDRPALAEDGVLVRVRASSVNPAEWYAVTGGFPIVRLMTRSLFRPKDPFPGVDFAGVVEAVGPTVTTFQPGDEVFGARSGAWAEYVHVTESRNIVHKPANVTFEQAASVGIAGFTALQGQRTSGQLQPGQRVLINGASGGVGTFAIQIAKALGAEVTAVCSTRNVDQARSLGADHVVDYTRQDFTRSGERYDLFLDVAGSRSWWDCRRVLTPTARFVLVGAPKNFPILGPIAHIAATLLLSRGASQQVSFFIAKFNKPEFQYLADLMTQGKLTPVVERAYPLTEVAAALNHLGTGHARAKIALTV